MWIVLVYWTFKNQIYYTILKNFKYLLPQNGRSLSKITKWKNECYLFNIVWPGIKWMMAYINKKKKEKKEIVSRHAAYELWIGHLIFKIAYNTKKLSSLYNFDKNIYTPLNFVLFFLLSAPCNKILGGGSTVGVRHDCQPTKANWPILPSNPPPAEKIYHKLKQKKKKTQKKAEIEIHFCHELPHTKT